MPYDDSRRSGNDAFHGLVHVLGSLTVTSYCSESCPVRVNFSTIFASSLSIMRLPLAVAPVRPLRFVVSTTRVFPSQWPRGSPMYERIFDDTCERPSSGTTRIS